MHRECPVLARVKGAPLFPHKGDLIVTAADMVGVVLGVDTHLDVHVGAVVDGVGRILGVLSIETTRHGYEQLLSWARSFGCLERAGVEGTGTYGASLTRFLTDEGIEVIEINRPNRARRRRRGKTDSTDAENAARAILAGEADAVPKSQSGPVEAMRVITSTRRSAVKARTQAANQIRAMIVTAAEVLRDDLRGLPLEECIERCARFSPGQDAAPLEATKRALRSLSIRWRALAGEVSELDRSLEAITSAAAPRLVARKGVGPLTAAVLMMTAGDNADRLQSEASLAALCGVSPVEASSGKMSRHRLNRGGDRQANNALWTIAMVRMRCERRTQEYVDRRTKEGRSTKEIRRCLKRYIVRELYPLILADLRDAREGS